MDTLLRLIAEWKARHRGAQVIVFDGGAEVERARAFLRGAFTGVGLTLTVFLLAGPRNGDPAAIEEARHRGELLLDANRRLTQAVEVAEVCLATAENLERTLSSYQSFLGSRVRPTSSD